MAGKFGVFNTQYLQREERESHKKLESTHPTLPAGENIYLQDPGSGVCMSPDNTSQERAMCHIRWLIAGHSCQKDKRLPIALTHLHATAASLKRLRRPGVLGTKAQEVGSGRESTYRDTCISTGLNFQGTDLQRVSCLRQLLHLTFWWLQILFTNHKLSCLQSTGDSAK